ncbi:MULTISPECIES: PqqD family protein [Streptomyces]|uniref:PqqD family protein n=1 Tax=Streptomyces TaxID=1883 RepID=UPI00345BBCDE
MPLIGLAGHVVFDDTDGAGVILDTRRGVYLSLNATATRMLCTALACDSVAAAVARLREDFDADEETLAAGLAGLAARLGEHALLEEDGGGAPAPRRWGRRRGVR